jgi:hypothetical protein
MGLQLLLHVCSLLVCISRVLSSSSAQPAGDLPTDSNRYDRVASCLHYRSRYEAESSSNACFRFEDLISSLAVAPCTASMKWALGLKQGLKRFRACVTGAETFEREKQVSAKLRVVFISHQEPPSFYFALLAMCVLS